MPDPNRWEKVSIESGAQRKTQIGIGEHRLETFAKDCMEVCKTADNFGLQTGKMTASENLEGLKGVSHAIVSHKSLPADKVAERGYDTEQTKTCGM